MQSLGLARRAGRLCFGYDSVVAQRFGLSAVFLSSDLSAKTLKNLTYAFDEENVKLIAVGYGMSGAWVRDRGKAGRNNRSDGCWLCKTAYWQTEQGGYGMSMTIKYKVHDFAKDTGLKSTEIIELLNKLKQKERTHMAILDVEEVDYLLNYYTKTKCR